MRERDLLRACPGGAVEYCVCANNPAEMTAGPFSFEEGLFGAFYTYSVCSPGTCFCKGDPDTPRDARNWPMRAIMDTWGGIQLTFFEPKINRKVPKIAPERTPAAALFVEKDTCVNWRQRPLKGAFS